jgi:hypothetical protein
VSEDWPKGRVLIAAAGAVALALLIGICVGRYSAPLKVETRDMVKTQYVDRVVEKRVEVAGATKVETRVIYRDVIRKPDGTIVDHTVTKTGDSETANSHQRTTTKAEAVTAATTLQDAHADGHAAP